MYTFGELKKNAKKDTAGHKSVKLAILGDSSTQFLAQAIKGCAYFYQIAPIIFEADFNQIERQVFDPSSELYDFSPEIILIFKATEKQLSSFYKMPEPERKLFSSQFLNGTSDLLKQIEQRLPGCKIISYNLPEIDNSIFGNYGNKTEASWIYQLRQINTGLMSMAIAHRDLFICDISRLQNQLGRAFVSAPAIYINTDAVFHLDFLPYAAKATMDIIAALQGRTIKCVVLDLDNTLWGGIIGDDGIENIQVGNLGIGKAFTELQYWLKSLKERGIILAVCSKNTESVARTAFELHPDMVLRMEDFSVFAVNWENKADNIRYIQSVLNIGFDSMVFLDDNPFEREMVRSNIPGITVPELPEDPALYLDFLYTLNLFETVSYSEEDSLRTAHYQTEARRTIVREQFTDENSFLISLNMQSEVQPFNTFNTPRVAQLSQRSNQFNLRTIRYSEGDIVQLAGNSDYYTLSFGLKDKFGDNGLICVVVLHKETPDTLFIENWFMSCRVLKRGMENFVLNTMMEIAQANGFVTLKGQYIPTAKNELVKDHYLNLGFGLQDDYWVLSVADYQPRECFITKH